MSMLHISACNQHIGSRRIVAIGGFKLKAHKTDLWKQTRVGSSIGCWKEKVQCVQSKMGDYPFGVGWN